MADQPKSFHLGPEIHQYIVAHGTPPDAVQQELIEETRKLGGISLMQIAPEQGAFMTLLARAIGARRAIEVGTFTGYSTLCLARGLPADGRVIACDVSEEWTAIARRYWEKAGVAEKIDLRIGPAARDPARAARGPRLRPRLHRRGQAELSGLLRADPRAPAQRRPDPGRQRALDGTGRESGGDRPADLRDPRLQRRRRPRPARRLRDARGLGRPDAAEKALSSCRAGSRRAPRNPRRPGSRPRSPRRRRAPRAACGAPRRSRPRPAP